MTRGQFVDSWRWVFREGPCALLDTLLDGIEPKLDAPTREVVRVFVAHVREQSAWIVKAREDLIGEVARVREIGEVMKRAGLRSYTDKEGRIYVSQVDA